jgi:hypothetical protein
MWAAPLKCCFWGYAGSKHLLHESNLELMNANPRDPSRLKMQDSKSEMLDSNPESLREIGFNLIAMIQDSHSENGALKLDSTLSIINKKVINKAVNGH